MQRFYITSPLSIDITLTDADIVHQLTRVMRVGVWDEIVLFDGDGSEYLYSIETITKKSITLRGIGRQFPATEPKKSITLYQALPNKLEKIEYILQKWVEVGIRRFVFFRSDFSQKLVISDAKQSRLISIAREALEQCGGLIMPEIVFDGNMPVPHSDERHITLDTTGISLKMQEMPKNEAISLWVGPEGGWSPKEREKMKDNGFIFARFGERVLRTETAGVVVSFALFHA